VSVRYLSSFCSLTVWLFFCLGQTQAGLEWSEKEVLRLPDDGEWVSDLGASVALNDGWAAVGAPFSNTINGELTGLVKFYHKSGGEWQAAGTLNGDNSLANDAFGTVLAMEGTLLAVGVPEKKVTGSPSTYSGTGTGEVQLFRRQEGDWVFEAVLRPPPGTYAGAGFGRAVAINGGRVVIGAPRSLVDSGPTSLNEAGRVFVFHQVAGLWVISAELTDPNPAANVNFGSQLAIEGGCVAVVRKISGSFALSMRIEVFDEVNGVWQPSASLRKTGVTLSGAIAMKNGRLAVGAPSEARDSQSNSGAVYLFTKTDGVWDEGTKIVPSNAALRGDQFGSRVSWANERLVVSGIGSTTFNSPPRWTVFELQTGSWTQVASEVRPSRQGFSALTSDGDTVLATISSSAAEERLRVLEPVEGVWSEAATLGEVEDLNRPDLRLGADLLTDGEWVMSRGRLFRRTEGALEPQPAVDVSPMGLNHSEWAEMVALGGGWLVMTSPSASVGGVMRAGKVGLFQLTQTETEPIWQFHSLLVDPQIEQDGGFGSSVCFLDDSTLAVGSPSSDRETSRGGRVYLYELRGEMWQRVITIKPPTGSPFSGFGNMIRGTSDRLGVLGGVKLKGQSIHVFERSRKGNWPLKASLLPPYLKDLHPTLLANTVYDIRDFSIDGDQVLVGVFLRPPFQQVSHVELDVYARSSSGAWRHKQRLSAPELTPPNLTGGLNVRLRDRLALVSLPGSIFHPTFGDSGIVHAFLRLDGQWSDAQSLQGALGFGSSLLLAGSQGEELWVGSPGEGSPAFPRSGTIRVHQVTLTPSMKVHDGAAANSPEVASADELSLGQSVIGASTERILRLRNLGHGPLQLTDLMTNNAAFEATWLTGPEVASEEEGLLRIRFLATELGAATAHLSFETNDPEQPEFELTLIGMAQLAAESPMIQSVSEARIVAEGDAVLWKVEATGTAPLRYVWKRDGRVIGGANDRAFVASAALVGAGNYTVEVRNGSGRMVSAAVPLAVVRRWQTDDVANEGGVLALDAVARGPGLSFQWSRDGLNLAEDDDRFKGTTTSKLRVARVAPEDAGRYALQLSLGAVTLSEAVASNVTIRSRPVLEELPNVSLWVGQSWQRLLNATPAPTSYVIRGLPPGIVFAPETATLSGAPRRAGLYQVRVLAKNEAGSSEEKRFAITVQEVEGLAGSYIGTVQSLPDSHLTGGRVTLAVSGAGLMTGEVMFGPYRYRFRRSLEAFPQTNGQVFLSTGGHFALDTGWLMRVNFNPITQSFEGDIRLSNNGLILSIGGTRATRFDWQTRPVTQSGRHTVALIPPVIPGGPLGVVHGVLTIQPNGRASWSGKLGDGVAITATSGLSLDGKVPLHFPAYGKSGAAQFWLHVGDEEITAVSNEDRFWAKRSDSTHRRSHSFGFFLTGLEVRGGRYVPPAEDAVLFDIPTLPGTLIFHTDFTAYYGAVAPNWQQTLDVATPGKAIAMEPNPRNLKVTINRTQGTFRGSWFEEGRRATIEGVMIPGLSQAWGHTLLDLPTSFEAKVKGKPAQVSGRVRVE
jgi:hypothetical protein